MNKQHCEREALTLSAAVDGVSYVASHLGWVTGVSNPLHAFETMCVV